MAASVMMSSFPANAQTKGRFEVKEFDNFKLHIYFTNDVMADASYIVEGAEGLVTLEQPLFKDNVAEFDAYIKNLNKPVVKCIASYHIGGTEHSEIVTPQGMREFSKGPIYGGMMKNFEKMWGDTMAELPTNEMKEVPFNETQQWAGVNFLLLHGATSDFPAASILIGKQVFLSHWAPTKSHVSNLQVSSPAAIDAEILAAENALNSGATLFVGGHGGTATKDDLDFKLSYLKKLKDLRATNNDTDSFATALKTAFPNLPGEDNVTALAQALYK